MNSKIEVKTANYTISEVYRHHANFSSQTASVILEIDFQSKSYSITPSNGTNAFQFKTASHQWEMWKAVNRCIDNAIDFANKQLEMQTP